MRLTRKFAYLTTYKYKDWTPSGISKIERNKFLHRRQEGALVIRKRVYI